MKVQCWLYWLDWSLISLFIDENMGEEYSQFQFRKVCHNVFSILEHATGCGLTLYTDENSPEVRRISAHHILSYVVLS